MKTKGKTTGSSVLRHPSAASGYSKCGGKKILPSASESWEILTRQTPVEGEILCPHFSLQEFRHNCNRSKAAGQHADDFPHLRCQMIVLPCSEISIIIMPKHARTKRGQKAVFASREQGEGAGIPVCPFPNELSWGRVSLV